MDGLEKYNLLIDYCVLKSRAEFFAVFGLFMGAMAFFFRYVYFNNFLFNMFMAAIVIFIVPTAINTIKAVKVLGELRNKQRG